MMNCRWRPDVRVPATNCLSKTIPALAFMDDMLWIAKSADDLSAIISIANSFYLFNDIQINWPKSELLVNKFQRDPFTIHNNDNVHQITAHKSKESIRYLGVWISLTNNRAYIVNQIHEEIKSAVTIMRKKKLTDAQLTYIYNTVILPRIEYKSQLTLPSERQCSRIMATYVAFVRNKLHFSQKTPSSLFLSHYFYNITSLHQRLVQNLSSAMLQMANETTLLGITFNIRTHHLRNKEWLQDNPLKYWPYDTHCSRDDWLPSLLSALNKLNIHISIPQEKLGIITGGNTLILNLIKPIYRN